MCGQSTAKRVRRQMKLDKRWKPKVGRKSLTMQATPKKGQK